MIGNPFAINDTLINALLLVSQRVICINDRGSICGIWDQRESDTAISLINNEAIISCHSGAITNSFNTGKRNTCNYVVNAAHTTYTFKLRLLPVLEEKDKLLIAVELISENVQEIIAEDYWKLALDAAGDGMWDVLVNEERISFSEKWYMTFGYSKNRLHSISDWVSLIHPDDIDDVQQTRTDYFDGKTDHYHSEFRLKTEKNGYKWVLSRGVAISRNELGNPVRFTGIHTDINDRKLAEEKYFTTAQLLSKLINNLRDGLLVTDEHGHIVYANQVYCDIDHIKVLPESLIGIPITDLVAVHKSFYTTPEKYMDRTRQILEQKDIILAEEWTRTDGRTLSRDFLPLVLGKDNKGGIWKFRDISEQKNAELKLEELRNFYEEILNNIAGDIVVFDANQKYLFLNPTAVRDTELRKWLIGKTDEDYCRYRNKSFDLVTRRRKIFESARESKQKIEWEEMLVNREGETEYHLRNMFPVFDKEGNHLYGIGYGINITDRVRDRQELKTSRDTFASAFNDSGIGMALISPEGDWLDVNHALCDISGYPREALLKLNFQDITHPDDLETDAELLERMNNREISTYSIEKRYISRNRKIVQALLTVSLVRNEDGTPRFFISQIIDITEKKKMEWELQKKTTALEATKEYLQSKINQLEDLSHIIAHNLRGPAGNIKMLAESMLEMNKAVDEPDSMLDSAFTLDEALVLIHDSSLSLMESLGTLMQVTEIKLNKEIPKEECVINQVLNDTFDQLQSAIFEKRAIITRDIQVKTVSYPRVYFENIVYNLISNALKYVKQGTPPEIHISTYISDGRVVLSVKDKGLGIDMDRYASRVFRLNETFHQGFESKGVGLYITKTQVESFGGSITLHSKPDEGSEFIVTL
jgi:PAS domain S-box-containing protein